MKTCVKTVALLLVLIFAGTLLVSCTPNLIGEWSGEYEYEGKQYTKKLTVKEDGTYVIYSYEGETLYSVESGSWEIDGMKLNCYEKGSTSTILTFEYTDGKLVNGKYVVLTRT
ncbi:MAG: hypothetical protein J5793_03955 [Clostridia bacterium]|nr:hypothetical protein [Clostridia bacterium]